jgi:hypothetical protein
MVESDGRGRFAINRVGSHYDSWTDSWICIKLVQGADSHHPELDDGGRLDDMKVADIGI